MTISPDEKRLLLQVCDLAEMGLQLQQQKTIRDLGGSVSHWLDRMAPESWGEMLKKVILARGKVCLATLATQEEIKT